jgi:hypothetical protein
VAKHAKERAWEELGFALGLEHTEPTQRASATEWKTLWELDTPLGRGVAGAFELPLGLERFNAGAFAGTSRLSGEGAPPELLRALPTRWVGVGRAELRYRDDVVTALCWGYEAGERMRSRAVRYLGYLLEAVHEWGESAPRIWQQGDRPLSAREVLEAELAWLSPRVVEGEGGLRALLTLDEVGGLDAELTLDQHRTELAAQLPPGPPRARLTRQAEGLFGWLQRRGELELGEPSVDDLWRIEAGEDQADALRALGPHLTPLSAWGAVVEVGEELRVTLDVGGVDVTVLGALAEAWRQSARVRLGL